MSHEKQPLHIQKLYKEREATRLGVSGFAGIGLFGVYATAFILQRFHVADPMMVVITGASVARSVREYLRLREIDKRLDLHERGFERK